MNPKQAIFYVRTNELEQLAGQAPPDDPFYELRDYAKLHGMIVIGEYTDAVSRLSHARPGLTALLDLLRTQAPSRTAVLITDQARLARDPQVHVMLKQQIEEAGGELIVTGFEPCTVFLNGLPEQVTHD